MELIFWWHHTKKPCRNAGLFWFVEVWWPFCTPFNGRFRPQKRYLLWRSCSRRYLLSTNKVFFVDALFSLAASVHKKGVFCGCTVLFGRFRPQKRYLLWRSCSRRCLLSTNKVFFVDALFSLAPSVHKKGVFCGCTVLFGRFRPQKGCLLWMSCSR